jgi:hypothetical protein
VALVGLALAGCATRGNNVLADRRVARPGGPLSAALLANRQPVPDPTQRCPTQFASWTDNGTSVTVNVKAPSGTYVAVSLEAGTTIVEGAASPTSAALTFSFPVPGAQVNAVRLRNNEAGCQVQKLTGP